MWNVAVYLIDLAYGGPEEGGWWYQVGTASEEHASLSALFTDEDAAYAYARALNEGTVLSEVNEGRPDISSVSSQGRYEAVVHDGVHIPKGFPEVRPHYE